MKNQERLSDLYFWHPNASEEEINEAIQASVQKKTEKAMKKIFPMTKFGNRI